MCCETTPEQCDVALYQFILVLMTSLCLDHQTNNIAVSEKCELMHDRKTEVGLE